MERIDDDAETDIGSMMQKAADVRVDKMPATLSVDVRQLLDKKREKEAAMRRREREGDVDEEEDEELACRVCEVGNANQTAGASERLRKVYDYIDKYYLRESRKRTYRTVAAIYNEEIWAVNKRIGKSGKKWDPSDVRYHLEECDKRSIKLRLYQDIDELNKRQAFLKTNGMYFVPAIGGEAVNGGRVELDKGLDSAWLRGLKEKRETYKLIAQLEGAENRAAVGATGKPAASAAAAGAATTTTTTTAAAGGGDDVKFCTY